MRNYLIDYYYRDENYDRIGEKQTDRFSAEDYSLALDKLRRKRGFSVEVISVFDEEEF